MTEPNQSDECNTPPNLLGGFLIETEKKMFAVYRFFDQHHNLLYVGMTKDPLKRITQHQTSERYWCDLIANIKIEKFDTQQQAAIAEKRAIINERPIHNKTHNKPVVQKHPTPNLTQVQKRTEPINTPNDRKAVRPKAASKILGISLATLWRWLAERPDFPRSRKIGSRTTVFMVDELLQFMEAYK